MKFSSREPRLVNLDFTWSSKVAGNPLASETNLSTTKTPQKMMMRWPRSATSLGRPRIVSGASESQAELILSRLQLIANCATAIKHPRVNTCIITGKEDERTRGLMVSLDHSAITNIPMCQKTAGHDEVHEPVCKTKTLKKLAPDE